MKIFDSHFHIIDGRFPLVANQGYLPQEFSCQDYLSRVAKLGVCGGAIVSGSFQAFDQSYALAALQTLGSAFVGVIHLNPTVTDEEILQLHDAGIRAVRFNLKRGVAVVLEEMEYLAHRIYELAGWHIEVYVDGQDLPSLYNLLVSLPRVAINHMGLAHAGLTTLLRLVEYGVHVKATGFGRLDFDPLPVIQQIVAINPSSLLFGTDLPSTRASRPFQDSDISSIQEVLDEKSAANVFYHNAIALYRPLQK